MKQTRKILAMLLCIAMVLGMATTVFATETYTITVPDDDRTYEIYQIFTGDLSEGVLSNVVWGRNGTGYVADKTTAVPSDVLEALEAVATSTDNKAKLDVINQYVKLDTDAFETLNTAEDEVSAQVAPGYYLIKDADDAIEDGDYDAFTTYIVQIVGDVTITRKASVPSVDKVILDYEDEVKVNEAAIGEDVEYKITGTLPATLADYKEYFYRFNDTLSKGLTYNDDLVVYVVNGEAEPINVTNYFYVDASEYNATTGTTITVAIGDILALNNVGITVNKDTKIVLEYSAVVNENALINDANPNEVDLDFSNNPNQSGEGTPGNPPEYPDEPGDEEPEAPQPSGPIGKTPESEVETYVTKVHIEKVDGAGNALEGASFEIYGTALKTVIVSTEEFTKDMENGTYWKLKDGTYTKTAPVEEDDPTTEDVNEKTTDFYESITDKYSCTVNKTKVVTGENFKASGAVGEDGKLTFTGLPAGTYTIEEIVTPAGYNTIGEITLVVTFDADEKTFSYVWSGAVSGTTDTIEVVNQAGSTLPETGGIGTTLFYVFGGIMVLGAAVLLVTKKRMIA